jgi:cell division protein FtsL
MKGFWQNLNKVYFLNSLVIGLLLISIFTLYFVQYQVENLQDDIAKTKNEISSLEDEIRLLEVEWVYLTRPERLRTLVAKYLKNNGYALASQIKSVEELEKFLPASYQQEANQASFISSDEAIPF